MKNKLLLSLALVVLFFHGSILPSSATTIPTVAPGKWYSPSLGEFIQKVQFSPDQEIFGERYTYAQVVWILHSFSSIMQMDVTSSESQARLREIFGYVQQGETPPFEKLASLGPPAFIIAGISELYTNPPASGIQYIAQGLEKFNLASPAFAQGYGFDNNTIVLPLWAASRNLCYFLMVVLLIAAGFMIMFRIKVNAQTAVSIQVMIPKIIFTLILITFSYAIAGFIVDLVYLLLTLILSALSLTGVVDNLGNAVTFFTGGFTNIVLLYLVPWIILTVVSAAILGALPIVITAIVSLVILWLLLRVFWMLIQSYLGLMIGFITAPWHILLGLVPGGKGGFGPWLRGMISNASVFVVVPLMFLLSSYIAINPAEWITSLAGLEDTDFAISVTDFVTADPTGVGIPPNDSRAIALPLFGLGSSVSFVMGFIASLALLSLTPRIATMIRDTLKLSAFKYGSAFGEALAPSRWATTQWTEGMARTSDAEAKLGTSVGAVQAANDRSAVVRGLGSFLNRAQGGNGR